VCVGRVLHSHYCDLWVSPHKVLPWCVEECSVLMKEWNDTCVSEREGESERSEGLRAVPVSLLESCTYSTQHLSTHLLHVSECVSECVTD
jgi:hypothetical protein